MKHSTFYFQHDYNARNDELILMLRSEYGAEGYGVFWMILETMAEASTSQVNRVAIGGLSLGYGVPKERLTQIIDYCVSIGLFEESQEGAISSARMRQHLAFRDSLKTAGRAGAAKRWNTSHENRVAIAPPMQTTGKETKEKQQPAVEFLSELTAHLRRQEGIANPKAWVTSLRAKASDAAIRKAWSQWKRGNGIAGPSSFYSRCIEIQEQLSKRSDHE